MKIHKFLQHLKKDHDKQKALGKKLYEAKDPAQREQLRKELHEELYPHMVGEEASFFAILVDAKEEEVRSHAHEGLQEHHVAKTVLKELMAIKTDTEIFKAKAKVLDELNRHHIEDEEGDIFPYLAKMPAAELDKLFAEYEKNEEKAKS